MKHVYDMSFAEFQIRLFAYERVQYREWEKVRMICYYVEASSMHRKKKMPSLEQFMPLGTDKKSVGGLSEAQKQRFLDETKKYQLQLEQLNSK